MNKEEKKAIDYLQFCYDISTIDIESLPKLGIALNLIDKLQKVINLMAEDRAELSEDSVVPTCKEAIIDFYFKQVEDKNEKK